MKEKQESERVSLGNDDEYFNNKKYYDTIELCELVGDDEETLNQSRSLNSVLLNYQLDYFMRRLSLLLLPARYELTSKNLQMNMENEIFSKL
ncbi:CLUMA_CG021605, isoform A [Clunio marinus]|uniref:CLUMA_CG021605, isoform A n=1 Tax=Clunio marinus TaxID=568069 RepID=A0A1J1J7C5_9DIPT|nr:CLUMA_CG021605, isoform A [Clunio marinus]